MMRELFDYEISETRAQLLANTAGAMQSLSRHVAVLAPAGTEPPFGYANLIAESQKTRLKR